jgi:hypothetical protein
LSAQLQPATVWLRKATKTQIQSAAAKDVLCLLDVCNLILFDVT